MRLLQEVSSSVVKNTYKVFTKLLFNNDASKGEQVMTKNGEPVLVMGGAKQTVNQFCERMLADALFHNNADRRFEPGAARIAISECKWNPLLDENPNLDATKLGMLKTILNYITENHNDRAVISNDLNGKSYQELYNDFGEAVEQTIDAKNAELNNLKFSKPAHEYKIVRIHNYAESKKYYNYTNPKSRWCLTYSIENYNGYTNYGRNTMYFCLRDDINTVEYKIGKNCPLDEYGKSMLCVIVNPKGELSTFTTRWNHKDANENEVAADKGVGDKRTISELIGANFNNVFIPDQTQDKLAEKRKKELNLDDIDALNADDAGFLSLINDNLWGLNLELLDEYDPDSDDPNPDDMSWSELLEHIDWNLDRVFGEIAGELDNQKCSAFENVILLCTTNNYFKLIRPINDGPCKSITNWCDDIKPVYTNNRNSIFAIKEHNSDYYKFISIDLINGNINNLQLDFENKFSFVHIPETTSREDDVLFVTFADNTLGFVRFLSNFTKATLKIKDIDLPEVYKNNNNQATMICGNDKNNNLLFKIKNPETGKYNLIYQKHGFKLELNPNDEFELDCNKYEIENYAKKTESNDIEKMNIPLLVIAGNKRYLIDLKTFKPINDKKGNFDNTHDVRLFVCATDEEKFNNFRDKLDKHNIELYYFKPDGTVNIGKVDNIYCSTYTFGSMGKKISYQDKMLGFGFTNPECTKIEIYDIDGNILYKSKEPLSFLINFKNPEKKKYTYLNKYNGNLILYNYYENKHYIFSDTELTELSKNISDLKNESIVLKYAAYLLG